MDLSKLTLERLRDLASEHELEGRSSMNKEELVTALEDLGVTVGDDAVATVRGFQQGLAYPRQPRTAADFQKLLKNPDLPAEYQSAPSMEQLNAHLFPDRLP